MKKPNIIVDVDGIILEFLNPFINYLNTKHNYNLTFDDITDYDIDVVIGKERDDFYSNIYKDFLFNHYPDKFEYIPGALSFFNNISKKFNLYLITALDKSKEEHRKNNLKDLKYKELIFEKDKQKYVNKLNPMYIFEDCPELINSYTDNKHFKGLIFVPFYPYTCNKLKDYSKSVFYHNFEDVVFSTRYNNNLDFF